MQRWSDEYAVALDNHEMNVDNYDCTLKDAAGDHDNLADNIIMRK